MTYRLSPPRAGGRRATQMGAGQIVDLDVVAHAGAVRRRVIRAEHIEMGALAQRRLGRHLDEVRGAAGSIAPSAPSGRRPPR